LCGWAERVILDGPYLSRIHDLFFESMIDNSPVKDRDIPTSLRLGRARHYRSVDTRIARGLDIP